MKVSQRHIAEALNLSINTVSRALRGHPDLAESTKTMVLEKARDLGYHRVLGGEAAVDAVHTRRAGVLFFEQVGAEREEDPLVSGVKRAIFLALQKECRKLEVETMVETPLSNEVPLLVKNRTIEAAFIFGRYSAATVNCLKGIPAIAVSSFIENAGIPRIVADNFNGIRLVTEHLVNLGHREILFLGITDPNTRMFEERADGFVAAMVRYGLTPAVTFWDGRDELPSVDYLRRFSALVCASDSLAYDIYARLASAGVRVPEECSIAGFDNLPSTFPHPVTTYAPDWALMGKTAANLLLSEPLDISNQNIIVTVPGRLLVRPSTGPFSR